MRIAIVVWSLLLSINVFAQKNIRPVLWVGPSDNVAVYGINISPIVFKLPTNSVVNGINIEGIGVPFFLYMIPFDPTDNVDTVSFTNDFTINGLNLAPAGILQHGTVNGIAGTIMYSFVSQVNGVEFSLFFNITYRLNGVSVSIQNSTVELYGLQIGLFNTAKRTKGVQLGLINKTGKLKGLQIGIWNINEKRKFPLINWS